MDNLSRIQEQIEAQRAKSRNKLGINAVCLLSTAILASLLSDYPAIPEIGIGLSLFFIYNVVRCGFEYLVPQAQRQFWKDTKSKDS